MELLEGVLNKNMLARSLTSVIGSDSLIVAFRKERVEYMRDILTALSLPVNENHIIQVIQ